MEINEFGALYQRLLQENDLPDSYAELTEKFYQLTCILLEASKKMNLTALKSEEDVIWKHIIDSLTAVTHIPEGATVLDVGTGAGFPALPLAIARPDISLFAVDATQKKIRYIRDTCVALDIHNLTADSLRIEEAAGFPAKKVLRNPLLSGKHLILSFHGRWQGSTFSAS